MSSLPLLAHSAHSSVEPTASVLSATGLTKRFGDLTAVSELSFSVAGGSITGFLGPNGAGKTTTLRMLVGLATPSSGEALVFGRRYVDLRHPASRVGVVLESADLHPGRTARDHLRVLAEVVCVPPRRVDAVLDLVGLADAAHRRAAGYSLGMRRRLGLAAALLGDPELLILDEPSNGLDPEGIRWLRELLRGFVARGATVLFSSHHLGEVEQIADRVLIMHRGRLVADAPLEELTAHSGASLEDAFLQLTAEPR